MCSVGHICRLNSCTWGKSHGVWSDDNEKHRRFLTAYLEGMGQPATPEELDLILFDCKVYREFHHSGSMAPWKCRDAKVIESFKAMVVQVSASADERQLAVSDGLNKTPSFKAWQTQVVTERLASSSWYNACQEALANATVTDPVPADAIVVEGHDRGVELTIKLLEAQDLVLQVKPGSIRLELVEGSADRDPNQKWLQQGELIQHVGTGLYLDADIKFNFHAKREGLPWDHCGGELFVKPLDASEPDRQRFCINDNMIRHVCDGRALEVNSWNLSSGQGVNINQPHTSAHGCSWLVDGKVADVPEVDSLVQRLDALGSFAPETRFRIKTSKEQAFCLSVRADGYTNDPTEIYLAEVDEAATKQLWTLVDGNQLRNCESGEFLHAEVKYPFLTNLTDIWEDNHSDLVTRPADGSDRQRWAFGLPLNGRNVLHHARDGRPVDVHGWNFQDGNNVGCENAAHSEAWGSCYILDPVEGDTATPTAVVAAPAAPPDASVNIQLSDITGKAHSHAWKMLHAAFHVVEHAKVGVNANRFKEKPIEASGADASSSKSKVEEGLIDLALKAMVTNGWSGVQRSQVTVKDTSGHGGSQTYKICAEGATPAAIALHSREKAAAERALSEQRTEAAALLYGNTGLGPERLGTGVDW